MLSHRRRLSATLLALACLVLPASAYASKRHKPPPPPPPPPSYQVPSSIASDCSVDVTQPILSWIASVPNNSTLSFGSGKCYRIAGTLEFSGRTGLHLQGNGSTFQSFSAASDQRALWRIDDSTGIVLQNMTLVGSYANGGTFDSTLQHAHAIDLRGSNAQISGVTMRNLAGDCVYFGLGFTSALTRSSGSLQNSSCTGTSRNAISVTAGDNILVQHVTASAIGYDVFDVEPNVGAGFGSNGVTFNSNTIGSYALSAYSIVENEAISNQAFTNNVVLGRGMKITAGKVSVRAANVTISGNSDSTAQTPSAMNLDSIDGLTVTNNSVAIAGGTMADVSNSCSVNVSGNTFPGGAAQASIAPYSCGSSTNTSARLAAERTVSRAHKAKKARASSRRSSHKRKARVGKRHKSRSQARRHKNRKAKR